LPAPAPMLCMFRYRNQARFVSPAAESADGWAILPYRA
jgi:hypothetical protein